MTNSSRPSKPEHFAVSFETPLMLSSDFEAVVDELWSAFEEIGIEDGYDIVAQATLLLTVRRLDIIYTAAEKKANTTGDPIGNPIFDTDTEHLRWSKLKTTETNRLFSLFETEVLQFVRQRGGTFSDVIFAIPSPSALSRLMDTVDRIPYSDPQTNGAVYEYLISKITTKNSSGGFPTPRHLVDLMVRMVVPRPDDIIADPACGTGGFLVAAANYVRKNHSDLLLDQSRRKHFHEGLFHGFDYDPAFARMCTTNLLLHGVDHPDSRRRDALAAMPDDVGSYSLVLTNPPFNGSVERSALDKDLSRDVKSTTKAPLFVGRSLSLLQAGGRAAIIVPDGVLFGSQKAQVALRATLIRDHKLDAVIKVPPAAYQPFSATQTSILVLTKTGVGGTDRVWFYEIRADGRSLDKKRTPVAENDLPDVLARWKTLSAADSPEVSRTRADQSFFVSREEIAGNSYYLTFDHYRQRVDDVAATRPPGEILAEIKALNAEIDASVAALEAELRT